MEGLTLTLRVSDDWLRLAAYTFVLREIAARGDQKPWEVDPDAPEPSEMAAAILRMFNDDEEEGE